MIFRFGIALGCFSLFPLAAVAAPPGTLATTNASARPVLEQTSNGVTLRIWRARWAKARELSSMSATPELVLEYDVVAAGTAPEAEKSLADYVLTANLAQNGQENEGLALGDSKLFRSRNGGYVPARSNAVPANHRALIWRADPKLKQYTFAWEWLTPKTEWDKSAPSTLSGAPPANFRHFRFVLKRDQIADFPVAKPLPAPLQSFKQEPYSLDLHRWRKSGARISADFILKRTPSQLGEPYLQAEATDQDGAKLEFSSLWSDGKWLFDGSPAEEGQKPLTYTVESKTDTRSVRWKFTLSERPTVESAFALDGLPLPTDAQPLLPRSEFKSEDGAKVTVQQIVRFDATHPLRYPPRTSGPSLPTEGIAVLIDIVPASPAKFLKIKRVVARDEAGLELSNQMTLSRSFGYDLVTGAPTPGFHETVLLSLSTEKAAKFNLRLRFNEFGEERKFQFDTGALEVPNPAGNTG